MIQVSFVILKSYPPICINHIYTRYVYLSDEACFPINPIHKKILFTYFVKLGLVLNILRLLSSFY